MKSKWLISVVLGLIAVYLFGGSGMGDHEAAERVAQMDAAEKEELRQKLERYEQLSLEKQSQLHQLHDDLSEQENADELRQVMREYYAWLKTLSSVERAELERKQPDERVVEIKRHVIKQERIQFASLGRLAMQTLELDPLDDEMETIRKWLLDWIGQHQETIFAAEPRLIEQFPEFAWLKDRYDDAPERKAFVYWARMHWVPELEVPRPDDHDFAKLLPQLREETRKKIESQTDMRQKELLDGLVQAAVFAHFHHRKVSTEDLREFYRKLPEERQAELASLPPDRWEAELRRDYMRSQGGRSFGPRGGPGRGPRGPGGPGMGPRPDRDRDERGGPRGGGPREEGREWGDRNRGDRPPEGPRRGPPRPSDKPMPDET
ncbi:MAG: hypothetical protein WDZ51_18155 [Pirellulaceae bacterium]